MTILVFGFEAFLEFDENPSDLVVRKLEQKNFKGQDVVAKILHVDYSTVEQEIVSAIDSTNPVLAIGFGVAPGREKFTPEKVAINYRYSREGDNTGRKMAGVPIDSAASDGIFTNLPVEGLTDYLNAAGIPSVVSTTAGSYLCNNAMFVIVREAKRRGFSGGFIHIPCHSEWVARKGSSHPSLPIETLVRASETSLEYCLERIQTPLLHPFV